MQSSLSPILVIVGVESLFTVLIFVLCTLIYHKTKELYQLTKEKSLQFFRKSFLFFSIAYIFRFFLLFVGFYSKVLPKNLGWIEIILLIGTGYFSTSAILYLAMSELWKKIDRKTIRVNPNHIVQAVAVTIAVITLALRIPIILAIVQLILLLLIIIISLIWKQTQKRKHLTITSIYVLLFVFWIANLLAWGPPGSLTPPVIQIGLRISSITIFFALFFKVLKWMK